MAKGRVTITLEESQLNEVRSLVASGQAPSVSAFVKHAVGVSLDDSKGWKEMLNTALMRTGGPLTDEERAWADGILDGSGWSFNDSSKSSRG